MECALSACYWLHSQYISLSHLCPLSRVAMLYSRDWLVGGLCFEAEYVIAKLSSLFVGKKSLMNMQQNVNQGVSMNNRVPWQLDTGNTHNTSNTTMSIALFSGECFKNDKDGRYTLHVKPTLMKTLSEQFKNISRTVHTKELVHYVEYDMMDLLCCRQGWWWWDYFTKHRFKFSKWSIWYSCTQELCICM